MLVRVGSGVEVAEKVAVGEAVLVGVQVELGVATGVFVAGAELVKVGVGVPVAVAEGAVCVGVAEGVLVLVGDALGDVVADGVGSGLATPGVVLVGAGSGFDIVMEIASVTRLPRSFSARTTSESSPGALRGAW